MYDNPKLHRSNSLKIIIISDLLQSYYVDTVKGFACTSASASKSTIKTQAVKAIHQKYRYLNDL